MAKVLGAKPKKATNSMIDLLVDIPLFDRLDGSELKIVVQYVNQIDVKPGEYVFKEGERGAYMCFVAHGIFDVLKKPIKGASLAISSLRKGQSIGEVSVIDSYPRSATVRARTSGALVTLSRDSFQSLIDQYPRIGIKLFQSISRLLCFHLRKTSSGFADLLFSLEQEITS